MIELIVTCMLATAAVFVPPQGWNVVKIQAYDDSFKCDSSTCLAIGGPDHDVPTTVTLSRQMKSGEKIELPAGCSVEAQPK